MKYLSVCSGIEAATVAWHPLGWEPVGFSEIDAFPSAVLQHHYPHVTNYGDFTRIRPADVGPVDLLVGGTPCQSFSLAGLRGGMDDERGNLALEFVRLADRLRARWLVWENVPGVLSSNGGRDFGAFLGALGERGYGYAYRVLDARGFGIPHRRRRVLVVGCIGDWRRAAAVLFERPSLLRDSEARRRAGDEAAEATEGSLGTGSEPLAFHHTQDPISGPVAPALSKNVNGMGLMINGRLRRTTPREAERLFGCPDDYTLVPYRGKPAPDSLRYAALGNSMAVPKMRWLGERIQYVDAL